MLILVILLKLLFPYFSVTNELSLNIFRVRLLVPSEVTSAINNHIKPNKISSFAPNATITTPLHRYSYATKITFVSMCGDNHAYSVLYYL